MNQAKGSKQFFRISKKKKRQRSIFPDNQRFNSKGVLSEKLDLHKQEKHSYGTQKWRVEKEKAEKNGFAPPSYFKTTNERLRKLYEEHKETATVIAVTNEDRTTSYRIEFDSGYDYGVYIPQSGGKQSDTSWIEVHFSITGIHFVSGKPNKYRNRKNKSSEDKK
ncbi:MAG: hypothetical protein IKQ92_13195 [Clostridia bacterium]|nr:hypothetical protein [Clostridia bacterium]